MRFINNLFKGFIRSAVNQVGRDGGRVVSNKIYKSKHSIPIGIIGNNQHNMQNNENYFLPVTTIEGKELHDYEFEKAGLSFFEYIGAFFASIIGIGIPILLIMAILSYNKKTITVYQTKEETVYVKDRRYSSGARAVGQRKYKISHEIYGTKEELKINKNRAKIYFAIALLPFILYALIYLMK